MSATVGKVALVKNSSALTGAVATCPTYDPDLVDLVGYGSNANCFEGTKPAPAPSNTAAIFRKNNGATDTNKNGDDVSNNIIGDFVTGAPNPRRTALLIDAPPSVSSIDTDSEAGESTPAPRDASIAVFFSESVELTGTWFDLTCATTGSHATTLVGGPRNWIISPETNFQPGEQCTFKIFALQVRDADTDDSYPNTDLMLTDFTQTFTIATGSPAPYNPGVHLTMGNPNNAIADVNQPNNYLIEKPEFALSYNRDRGTPNWVSWHLSDDWTGSLTRVDTFRPDIQLPADWNRVTQFDYQGSGFDRGHMTPSADRLASLPVNQATFLMDNIIPQAPENNQKTWNNMEGALRTYTPTNELYIVAGGAGTGGSGNNGFATTIANGKVTVPAFTWKVALMIPKGEDDISRVTCSARTIAVIVPNTNSVNADWTSYLTTVDAVENLTGYDFFSNLPDAVENCVEAGVNGANPPGTENLSVSTVEDTSKSITLTAASANNNPLAFTIVNSPSHGTITGSGANRVYTPATDFVGTDSFTFRASDGQKNSNISTVTITVTEFNENPIATNDAKSTQEDTQLIFNAADLLANDNAGDSNELNQTLNVANAVATANTHGTVTYSDGQITYIPDADYNGSADFSYQVCDNGTTNGAADGKCATGVVNVTIDSVNDKPIANTDSAVTNEDTAVTIDVLGNDTDIDADNILIDSVGNASKGISVVSGGKVLYTPNQNANGSDSFSYIITDGSGGTSTGTVNIVINPVNDAPTAINDSAATDEDAPVTIDAVANDNDVDGDSLSLVSATNGAHGAVAVVGGKAVYTPQENYFGSDSFTYVISDGQGGTATATVNVLINPINDAPTLAPISNKTVVLGNTLSFTAVASDIDLPAQTLTFDFVGAVPAGAAINSTNGSFS